MRIVFLDTETTGLSPESGDRIVEIGCIEMHNRRLTGNNRHYYLNPERGSHPDALKVHGLTDEFLADKPRFAQVAEELMAFLAGAEVVIHNAVFDVGFMDAELERLALPRFASHVHRVTDSLSMARELYPGKSNSLDALCKRLEVDNASRALHGALLDAGLLAEVFVRMTRGQESFAALDEAERDSAIQTAALVDLASFALPVIEPDADELAAHLAMLAELDKASQGRTMWRAAVAQSRAFPGG